MGAKTIPRSPAFPPVLTSYKLREIERSFFGSTTDTGRARGRLALGCRFEGGEGRGQHAFGIARPLIELGLALVTPPGRELFHIPDFRHPRAAPTGLQAVGPAHIGAIVGVGHELKAPAALSHGDHHRHRPGALAGSIVAEEAVAHLAAAAALPLATDVLRAPLPHTLESGDKVVDGFWGRIDFDAGFTMHAMNGHKHSPW